MEACPTGLCSVASLAAGEDPVGTATAVDLLLVVEVSLPWEREIWRSPDFPTGLFDIYTPARTGERKLALLCVAPDPEYSQPGLRRLMVLRRPEGPFAAYAREEYLVPDGQFLPLVGAVLAGSPLEGFSAWRQDVSGVRDLMVCTHGSVDAACGRYGIPLYDQLRREVAPAVPGLRAWRVSHFGGHRFAATALELPDMRFWAHLEPGPLSLLIRRDGSPAEVRRHYRGWGGLATPFEQALEREILVREGWNWLDYDKEGRVLRLSADGTEASVSIAFRSPDGARVGTYQGRVAIGHSVTTVTATGKGPASVPQYVVLEIMERPRPRQQA